VTEREVLLDAIYVGRVDGCGAGQPAAAFRIFRLEQMAFASSRTIYLAAAVILKRLATDFFVLNPFGASHNSIQFLEKSAQYNGCRTLEARGIFRRFNQERTSLNRSVSVHPLPTRRLRGYLPSVMLEGKPFSQLLGESQGLAERLSDSLLHSQSCSSCCNKQQCKSQYLTLLFSRFQPV